MFIQLRDEGQQKKERKKARQAKNPKGRSRQKLGQEKKKKKKKKARLAENPKGQSRQKLGPKKRRRRKEKLENPTKFGI